MAIPSQFDAQVRFFCGGFEGGVNKFGSVPIDGEPYSIYRSNRHNLGDTILELK